LDGSSHAASPAEEVVAEIKAMGGEAVANHDNVAEWEGGQRLVQCALETYGVLHVLVNNAGILRDRVLVNLSEEDWDSVINVHLKGHFVPTRHAANYWREEAKAGHPRQGAIINTSSTSGLLGNIGQSNYGAAKAGIAAVHRSSSPKSSVVTACARTRSPRGANEDDRVDARSVGPRRRTHGRLGL